MFDWIKKIVDWFISEPNLRAETPKVVVEEVVKEKTKEEILIENIIQKYDQCRNTTLLKKVFKIRGHGNYYYIYRGSYVCLSESLICSKIRSSYALKKDYEYAETFYQYLCKAVDKINAHVEKKELRRKTKEMECMQKFIGEASLYDNPQALHM